MRKFRNKKLATVIIAFMMVLTVAGGFAALQRFLTINARVHMFAPMVDVVWQAVTIDPASDPPAAPTIWTSDNPRGIGVPSAHERFWNRRWPVVDSIAIDNHLDTTNAPGAYILTRATALSPARPLAVPPILALSTNAQASAWWSVENETPGRARANDDQHNEGEFPGIEHIEERTLANPREYITLNLAMVFDNLDQRYDFRVTMGNPGDVALTTTAVYYDPATAPVVPGQPAIVAPDDDTAAAEIIHVNWDNLVGVDIMPGETVTRYLSFKAPEWAWMEFFATDEGIEFLDTNFNVSVLGEYTVRVVAELSPTGTTASTADDEEITDRPPMPVAP